MKSVLLLLAAGALLCAQSITVPGDGAPAATTLSASNPASAPCVASALVFNYMTGHLWGCVGKPGAALWRDLTASDPTSPQLLKWRSALAKMRNGASDAKILCVGDSTTEGYGDSTTGTLVAAGAYPTRLASLLNAQGITSVPGLVRARAASALGSTDNRWSLGGSWQAYGSPGYNFGGAGVLYNGGAAGNLVYTPGGNYTYNTFDVYYLRFSGGGTISATATGGSTNSISVNGASAVLKITATAASASTANAVSISGTGDVFVVAIEPYNTGTKSVRVGNAGVSGSTSANWTGGFAGMGSLASVQAYAPDLTIISLGINDAGALTSLATTSANLQAIIAAAQASGDVLLLTTPASSTDTLLLGEASLAGLYRSLGATYGAPVVDVFNSRFSAAYQSTLMFDLLHPNDAGYAMIAAAVGGALLSLQ